MKIFLAGGTGFLGKYLCRVLPGQGHDLTVLTRPGTSMEDFGRNVRVVKGDPTEEGDWQESLTGHDAVINLTGTSIFQRWTRRIKEEILASRILATENIVSALTKIKGKEVHLLNASGVGYYGPRGDNIVDEDAPPGDTFLASVAKSWESAARRAEEAGIRVVLCRFGIVLGQNGGAWQSACCLSFGFILEVPGGAENNGFHGSTKRMRQGLSYFSLSIKRFEALSTLPRQSLLRTGR